MLRRGFSKRWLLCAAAASLLAICISVWIVHLTHKTWTTHVTAPNDTAAAPKGNRVDSQVAMEVGSAPSREATDMNAVGLGPSEPNRDAAVETPVAIRDNYSPPSVPARFPPLGYTIKGRVLSKDGPVREDPNQWPPSQTYVEVSAPNYRRQCGIDEQGGFQCGGLGEGSYTVNAFGLPAPLDCRPVKVDLGPQNRFREVVLFLRETALLPVLVLEEQTGQPVSDCCVRATPTGESNGPDATTDLQGGCVLNLLPGRYTLLAGENEANRRQVIVQSSAINPVVTLLASAPKQKVIQLILKDAQGNPIEGYVEMSGVEWEPDAQPMVVFCAPDPTYLASESLIGCATDASGKLARRFLWSRDDLGEEVAIALEPRADIVGQAVDVEGRPVPDADIGLMMVLPGGGRRSEDESPYGPAVDETGGFRLSGLPVGFKALVTADRRGIHGQSDIVELKAGATVDVGRLVLKPAEEKPRNTVIKGRITDETGQPAVNCRVAMLGKNGLEMPARPYDVIARMSMTGGEFRTDAEGCFAAAGLPDDEPIMVTARTRDGGSWFRVVTGSTDDCDIQVHPQGWGVLGGQAPALVVDRWFNHVPVTWEDLRGRVVVLVFLNAGFAARSDLSLDDLEPLYKQYAGDGLFIICVYGRSPRHWPQGDENGITRWLGEFRDMAVAGCLDADPDWVQDVMPAARPAGAAVGATHWLYHVSKQPAMFLIDKQGRVRYCVDRDTLAGRVRWLLTE